MGSSMSACDTEARDRYGNRGGKWETEAPVVVSGRYAYAVRAVCPLLTVCLLAFAGASWSCATSPPAGLGTEVGGTTSGLEAASSFWLWSEAAGLYFARTETTVERYGDCVGSGACTRGNYQTKSENEYCNSGYPDRGDHPMNCVSWVGAEQFCEWIGGRLPTRHEWYTEASDGGHRTYPWGEDEPDCHRCVWDQGCGKDRTWQVCSKRRGDSASGLCDMSGNVWEWTASPSASDPERRIILGGGFFILGEPEFHRTVYGASQQSGAIELFIGFRCVKSKGD